MADPGVGEPAFRVGRQIQQLCQCIYMRFTVEDNQALQAIPGIFQCRLLGWLLHRTLLHDLWPRGRMLYELC